MSLRLFHIEFLFVDRESPPDEDEQYDAYSKALSVVLDGRASSMFDT